VIVRGGEFAAQRRHGAGQVHPDRSGLDAQLPGDGVGVQVQEDPQCDHLALAARQAAQRCQQGGVETTAEVAGGGQIVIGQRHFAAAPAPQRGPGVERGAHHPCLQGRMAADLPPRRPCPGERLRDLVFG
jgi:hypothetical protein